LGGHSLGGHSHGPEPAIFELPTVLRR
jgi:hypothetical protein